MYINNNLVLRRSILFKAGSFKTLSYLFHIMAVLLILSSNLYAEDLLDKGMTEFKNENYEEAIDLFLKAKEQQPESSTPSYYLGLIYKQLGNYTEAANYLTSAVSLTPLVKDMYIDLADIFYNLGEFRQAREWLAKAEKEAVRPASSAFLTGLILLKEGDNKGAIEAFTRAMDTDKSLTQTATFQIAIAYSNDRKLAKAREAFKSAVMIDPTTDIAIYAREYEKSLAASIEGHKAWRVAASSSYSYDDNVVLKPSALIPALEITGEKDSSIAASFRADYSPLIDSQWFFNGQYFLNDNTYFKTSSHNLIIQNIALMPGYMFKQGAVTLPLAFTYVWLHEKEYMSLVTARPTLNISSSSGQTGQISIGYAYRKMLQAPLSIEEDRDANIYSASLGYIIPIAEDKGVLNLRYEFSRDLTKGTNWENTGHKINAGLFAPLTDKVRFTIALEAYQQDYKYTNTAFDIKRKDTTYTGTGMVMWNIYKTLSLNIQYSHTTADSNITVYGYNRNIYSAGFEYGF